jgi:lipopolysaccharide exporter
MFQLKPINFIKKSEFLSNTAFLIGGTIFAQALPFVFSPLISRLFTPEDFSVYGVFISLYSILGTVLSLKYDTAIMLPDDLNKAKNLVILCLLITIVLSFLSFLFVLFFGKYLIDSMNFQLWSNWLLLIPLSAFFLSINNILINWYNKNKQYNIISLNKISRNALLAGFNIAFGLITYGHCGLIFSQLFSDGLAACYYFMTYYFKALNRKNDINFCSLKKVAALYKDFPFFTLPSTLLDNFSTQLPILLITYFFPSSKSGSYFFAVRILAIPVAVIGFAYGHTFFQKFVSYVNNENYRGARKFLYQSWLLLFSLISLPAVVVIFWGEPLFSFIFGSEWSESGSISSILIFYIMFSFISSPTSSTYISLRMQKQNFFFGILVLAYRFISFYIGYLRNDFYLALKILVIMEIIEIVIYNSVVLIRLRSMSTKEFSP